MAFRVLLKFNKTFFTIAVVFVLAFSSLMFGSARVFADEKKQEKATDEDVFLEQMKSRGNFNLISTPTYSQASDEWKNPEDAHDKTIENAALNDSGMGWIEYDFGREYTLDAARIHTDNTGNWYVETWKILYSKEGVWFDLFAYTESPEEGWNELDFEDITTDKIRIYTTMAETIELREFECYGQLASSADQFVSGDEQVLGATETVSIKEAGQESLPARVEKKGVCKDLSEIESFTSNFKKTREVYLDNYTRIIKIVERYAKYARSRDYDVATLEKGIKDLESTIARFVYQADKAEKKLEDLKYLACSGNDYLFKTTRQESRDQLSRVKDFANKMNQVLERQVVSEIKIIREKI